MSDPTDSVEWTCADCGGTMTAKAPVGEAKIACLRLADRYAAIAAKAQKDSYARDRAESMARACRECAQEVGR